MMKASPFNFALIGYFISSFLDMFLQDVVGLQGYIEMVNEGWVDRHWGMGLAGLLSVLALYFCLKREIVLMVIKK
jgi:hypothetical protein